MKNKGKLNLTNFQIKRLASIATPVDAVIQDVCYVPDKKELAVEQYSEGQSYYYCKKVDLLTKRPIVFTDLDQLFTDETNPICQKINRNRLHVQCFKYFNYNYFDEDDNYRFDDFWITAIDSDSKKSKGFAKDLAIILVDKKNHPKKMVIVKNCEALIKEKYSNMLNELSLFCSEFNITAPYPLDFDYNDKNPFDSGQDSDIALSVAFLTHKKSEVKAYDAIKKYNKEMRKKYPHNYKHYLRDLPPLHLSIWQGNIIKSQLIENIKQLYYKTRVDYPNSVYTIDAQDWLQNNDIHDFAMDLTFIPSEDLTLKNIWGKDISVDNAISVQGISHDNAFLPKFYISSQFGPGNSSITSMTKSNQYGLICFDNNEYRVFNLDNYLKQNYILGSSHESENIQFIYRNNLLLPIAYHQKTPSGHWITYKTDLLECTWKLDD